MKFWTIFLLILACSSSEKKENRFSELEEITESSTDFLPEENPEELLGFEESFNSEAYTQNSDTVQSEVAQESTSETFTQNQQTHEGNELGIQSETSISEGFTPLRNESTIVVQKYDTLMKISYRMYGNIYRWKEILDLNRDVISNPMILVPGTKLKVIGAVNYVGPQGQTYLVLKGDTLGKIAKKVYGSTRKWKKLWEENKALIRDPNRIYAGFELVYHTEDRLPASLPPGTF